MPVIRSIGSFEEVKNGITLFNAFIDIWKLQTGSDSFSPRSHGLY
jgi:hypothetical protein